MTNSSAIAERTRATAAWVSFGQKWKRIYSADISSLSSTIVT